MHDNPTTVPTVMFCHSRPRDKFLVSWRHSVNRRIPSSFKTLEPKEKERDKSDENPTNALRVSVLLKALHISAGPMMQSTLPALPLKPGGAARSVGNSEAEVRPPKVQPIAYARCIECLQQCWKTCLDSI